MDADEWSSVQEIEEEMAKAIKRLQSGKRDEDDPDYDENEDAADQSAPIDEVLSSRTTFTLSLLQRLCSKINISTGMLNADTSQALASAKEAQAQQLLLTEKVTALSIQLIQIKAKLRVTENDKLRIAKSLYKAQTKEAERAEREKAQSMHASAMMEMESINASSSSSSGNVSSSSATGDSVSVSPQDGRKSSSRNNEEGSSSSSSSCSSSSSDSNNGSSSGIERTMSSSSGDGGEVLKELRKQLGVLERQVVESETAKVVAEHAFTKQLANKSVTKGETDTQVVELRRSLEETRQQGNDKAAALLADSVAKQEHITNLEASLALLERTASLRMDEVVEVTKRELQRVRGETVAVQQKMAESQADLNMVAHLKTNLAELEKQQASYQREELSLSQQLTQLRESKAQLEKHIQKSRDREVLLEKMAGIEIARVSAAKAKAAEDAREEGEEREIGKGGDPAVAFAANAVLVQTSQQRLQDMQGEIDNQKACINDLIAEIEALSAGETDMRDQNARILQQVTESQSLQRVALEDNVKLRNEIEDLKIAIDIESKCKNLEQIVGQQETMVVQLRMAELFARDQIQVLKKAHSAVEAERLKDQQRLGEQNQIVKRHEQDTSAALERTEQLQRRCDALTSQAETDRKARMEAERKVTAKVKAAKKAVKDAEKEVVGEDEGDKEMLETTLHMLRCSVCLDRFKSVAITRCFHLFCKECVDQNLRDRHRKCPACGEKFGQDDVRNIHF